MHGSYAPMRDLILTRKQFFDRLANLAASAEGTIFLANVDRFVFVNHVLGHDAGDKLLLAISELVLASLPPASACARVGSDEFAGYIPEGWDANHILESLRLSIELSFAEQKEAILEEALGSGVIKPDADTLLTISIGWSRLGHGKTTLDLLNEADHALYSAKMAGRNRIHQYAPERPESDA